ncbi:MAG: hypothetical protein OXC40_02875 [Proteobacteria bacterium]|nr:hypothetical protein [Pseudomonadota bacterium]
MLRFARETFIPSEKIFGLSLLMKVMLFQLLFSCGGGSEGSHQLESRQIQRDNKNKKDFPIKPLKNTNTKKNISSILSQNKLT